MFSDSTELLSSLQGHRHLSQNEVVEIDSTTTAFLNDVIQQLDHRNVKPQFDGEYYYSNWMPTDCPALYKDNLGNETSRKLLDSLGWIDADISYRINQHGFRTDNFHNSKDLTGIVVYGCSYTSGVGLPIEKVYTSLLQDMLGIKVWNLGVPGTGPAQLVNHAIVHLRKWFKPDAIVLTLPPLGRDARWEKNFQGKFFNSIAPVTLEQSIADYTKSFMALKHLGNEMNIPVVINSAAELNKGIEHDETRFLDLGRDLMHFGTRHHRHWAGIYYQELKLLLDK